MRQSTPSSSDRSSPFCNGKGGHRIELSRTVLTLMKKGDRDDGGHFGYRRHALSTTAFQARDQMESRPFAHGLLGFGGETNVWGEPAATTFMHQGDKPLAKHIATELMEQDFPISYAFTNSHHAERHGPTELTHAFLNALLFLDWDRKGFDYPVVPIQVNAFGKDVVPNRGVIAHLDPKTQNEPFGDELGPPAPSAASCARLGGLLRDILEARSGKYVIMTSSGWSHAFLVAKHHTLRKD